MPRKRRNNREQAMIYGKLIVVCPLLFKLAVDYLSVW